MISSIFGKTKPINFVFVFAYLLLHFCIVFFFRHEIELTTVFIAKAVLALAVLIFTVFLIDFMTKKNALSLNNSYVILLFVLLLSMFPQTLLNFHLVVSNCFILLAMRKCLSMKSMVDTKKKIFDASFWIGVGALFHNWALLALIVVFIAILYYEPKDFKNWIIPLIALLTISVFIVSYAFLFEKLEYLNAFFSFDINFRIIQTPLEWKYLIPFIFILSIGVLSLFIFFIKIKAKTSKTQTSIFLTTILFIVGVVIALLSGNYESAEFVFIAFPLAVIVTNYLELINAKWYKESILWIFLLIPVLLLL